MLVDNNRLARALRFKQSVEEGKSVLDLPSYGSLIDYYARHDQLGSSLLLLKECLAHHGAAPVEKYLSKLRILCRQCDMEREVHLEELIGEDPVAWLKHGERFLKREKSKKGRRNLHLAQY